MVSSTCPPEKYVTLAYVYLLVINFLTNILKELVGDKLYYCNQFPKRDTHQQTEWDTSTYLYALLIFFLLVQHSLISNKITFCLCLRGAGWGRRVLQSGSSNIQLCKSTFVLGLQVQAKCFILKTSYWIMSFFFRPLSSSLKTNNCTWKHC